MGEGVERAEERAKKVGEEFIKPAADLAETTVKLWELQFLKEVNTMRVSDSSQLSQEDKERSEKITLRIREEFDYPCPPILIAYLNTLFARHLHRKYSSGKRPPQIVALNSLGTNSTLKNALILVKEIDFEALRVEVKSLF
ncbi:MAG: hypothetical protein H7230_02355 [Candidatus Parcubacteria bacterium]|nr:hypothetical protein [Candidatus Paceibacterota bacterium]